jgi:hypothetical protein
VRAVIRDRSELVQLVLAQAFRAKVGRAKREAEDD